MESLLKLKNISVHYGGVHALEECSIVINEGEVVALMGPNGAGKSTILKAIFGIAPISQGEMLWRSKPLVPVAHEVVRRGIAFVPQGRRIFRDLSVEENLEIGAYVVQDKDEMRHRMNEVLELFPALKIKRKAKSRELSGGQQQMVAIARGLMVNPQALLLDEPSLGLAPKIVKEVFKKIKEINERKKIAIIIVEHNIKSILHIVDRAYVLDKGRVVKEGAPEEILASGILEKVFLGV